MAAEPPDQFITPAVRRQLRDAFQQALLAAELGDLERATRQLRSCVVQDPGNLVFVETFLSHLQKRGKRGRSRLFGRHWALKKAAARQQWPDVLRLGAELLTTDPLDTLALRCMAEACAAWGYTEAELRYLRSALEADTSDGEVNRHAARSLARTGQFDQAMECWRRVQQQHADDSEAARMIAVLGDQSSRPATDRDLSGADLAGLQQALSADPTKVENYVQLADRLRQLHRFDQVERVLTQAQAAAGNDLRIRELLEDNQMDQVRQQLAIAERQLANHQTEQNAELVRQWKAQVNRCEIQVIGCRSERYPRDQQLKFELGVRLKRDGNYSEALKYLSQLSQDEDLLPNATLEMGECLQYQQHFTDALQHYEQAAQRATPDSECRKLALYRAGVLAIGLGQLDKAEDFFGRLQQIDSGFKDAQDHLDRIQRIRDKG